MEKFEIDMKWGSYFFIVNTLSSIFIVLIMYLINSYSLIYLSDILIPVFIIQLLYFVIKAVAENKKHDLSRGYRKFFVFIRLLVFYFMLVSFSNESTNIWCFSLLLPYRRKDISELVIEENSNEDNGITLNEFIVILKRKFSRL
ncbi:hypothetical protein [Flavobacterium sp. SORGH_AS_0622]|uniref:hypothetical protein n=1 Tax=Flavobacterium sp. SORGH_AS_0622 TaxID=3041772 RepID=UPI0027840E52|nr:hypothetical protein [Flavobacterium sp. SORGH_AS_0622]MDQ1167970.1 hypothetical protein [Flavobacterium sp. SORGH_AS_0622]